MDTERERQARAIADAAIALEPDARGGLLDRRCGGDVELRREAARMLAGLESGDDATATAAGPALATWGPLTLLEEIGRGGFGRVYRAWDPNLAREVALKLIPAPGPAVADAVLREGRLLARVQHANVVTVFGAQKVGDEVGLWMEFVRGITLADLVRRDGRMSATEAAAAGAKVCLALSAVHEAGLVHRDVKARNVMRADRGRIVLMDFGAGRDARTRPSDIVGTPAYMAYEVLAGRAASPASDVYSVGVLLFFLVTGTHPVRGNTFDEVRREFERGHQRLLVGLRSDLPDAFVEIVQRALAVDPGQRFESAAELYQALSHLGIDAPMATPSPAPVPAPVVVDPARIAAAAAGGLVVAMAALLAAGFLATTAFDLAYGRVAEFARGSPGEWLAVGARAMVAPAVMVLIGSLILVSIVAVCRLLGRVSSYCRNAGRRLRAAAGSLAQRVGFDDPIVAAAALCAAGLVAMALVWWRFADLLLVVRTPLSHAPQELLVLLAEPQHDAFGERALYRFFLEILLFLLLAGWVALWRSTRGRPDAPLPVRLAPVPVLLLAMLMLVVPYRVLYPGAFERADLDGAACYIVGEREADVLLLCPSVRPPRSMVVAKSDARLVRTGVWEEPFTQLKR